MFQKDLFMKRATSCPAEDLRIFPVASIANQKFTQSVFDDVLLTITFKAVLWILKKRTEYNF